MPLKFLPRINIPVLLLFPQQDTTTLPSASQYMPDRIPDAQLTVVSPSAPYSLLEKAWSRRFIELKGFAGEMIP
jgi:pimeloyl-ACP methyl ester carboxylesterase